MQKLNQSKLTFQATATTKLSECTLVKNFQCKGSPNSLGSAINSPSAENTIFDKDSERLIPDALTIASFRHQQTNPRISRSLSDAANIH